jgi:ketosteroid isomerase-like protein
VRRAAALACALLAACTPMPPSPDPGRTLADAESAFAAHSVREGMRAAFIAHFAPDGVFVRDGWTAARAWLEPRPDPPIVLDWRPVHVEVAASGELGLSTGPWKLVPKADPARPPAFGQFVSIWKREGDAPWQVAVDLGVSHPTDALWGEALRTAALDGQRASETIAHAEAAFALDARTRGLRAAYTAHASPRIRYYREGEPPALGAATALASGIGEERDWNWIVEKTGTARSGDFGYALGRFAPPGASQPTGAYLRVWAAERGAWRIVLDVTNPPRER